MSYAVIYMTSFIPEVGRDCGHLQQPGHEGRGGAALQLRLRGGQVPGARLVPGPLGEGAADGQRSGSQEGCSQTVLE